MGSRRERDEPSHGDIVEVAVPAYRRRRRWCGTCKVWTWERGSFGSGKFFHGAKRRKPECKEARA